MLNLWAHDVGRADGQAYSVLRSVFEEAVRLYEGGGQDGDGGDGVPQERGEGGGAVAGGPARFPKVKVGRTRVYAMCVCMYVCMYQVLRDFWERRSLYGRPPVRGGGG